MVPSGKDSSIVTNSTATCLLISGLVYLKQIDKREFVFPTHQISHICTPYTISP